MILLVLELVARRLLAAIPILLIVSALLFCVLRLLPVDPAAMSLPPTATLAEVEAKRREMGLDQPLPQQYLIWLNDVLHGDFGRSIHLNREAGSLVAATLPATIELAVLAMMLAAILGFGGGLLMFHARNSVLEAVVDMGSILLLSVPEFLWGLILLFVFGVMLQMLPFTGRLSPGLAQPHITGFPARCHDQRTLRRARERVAAFAPAGSRARTRVLARDHAGAARLPAGANAATRVLARDQERGAAHAYSGRRPVRLPVQRHAAGRSDLLLSGSRQPHGRCRAQRRPAADPGGGAHLLRRRAAD